LFTGGRKKATIKSPDGRKTGRLRYRLKPPRLSYRSDAM
jgi:hypothetical protein